MSNEAFPFCTVFRWSIFAAGSLFKLHIQDMEIIMCTVTHKSSYPWSYIAIAKREPITYWFSSKIVQHIWAFATLAPISYYYLMKSEGFNLSIKKNEFKSITKVTGIILWLVKIMSVFFPKMALKRCCSKVTHYWSEADPSVSLSQPCTQNGCIS